MSKDQVKGRLKEMEDKVKEVTGDVVGNKTLKQESKVEKANGEVREKYGDVKSKIKKGTYFSVCLYTQMELFLVPCPGSTRVPGPGWKRHPGGCRTDGCCHPRLGSHPCKSTCIRPRGPPWPSAASCVSRSLRQEQEMSFGNRETGKLRTDNPGSEQGLVLRFSTLAS